jgi:quercetin dioxygenase-like cupin family protein
MLTPYFFLNFSMKQDFWVLGTHMRILADHTTTEGRYDLVEGTFPPNEATSLHLHTAYSEQFYTLEGEFTLHIGDEVVVLKPGDSFYIPIGTKHAFVSGPAGGRGILVASPSGYAQLIQTVATPAAPGSLPPTTPPDMEAFGRALLAIGDELVGPPPAVQ